MLKLRTAFRILTAIGNSEAMKNENQIKDNGNWSTLKNTLQLAMVSNLAFLLTSQEEAFEKQSPMWQRLGQVFPYC